MSGEGEEAGGGVGLLRLGGEDVGVAEVLDDEDALRALAAS